MDTASVIDVIIQSSVVALFHASGVAVAPQPPSRAAPGTAPVHELTGMARFNGRGVCGTLLLSFPKEVLSLLVQNGLVAREPRDLLREFTNQLMGRVKNRLLQFQVTLHTSIPLVLDHEQMRGRRISSPSIALYRFRTLRGEVLVVLEGVIDESTLVYSGSVKVSNEGDIILF